MTKHTNPLLERIEKAAERRRGSTRDAGIATLEKRRDGTKEGPVRERLTKHLEMRRGYLERKAKRKTARAAKRAARRAKRGRPAAPVADAPAAPFADLNARDAIARIADMSASTLAAARTTEEARDKPRTTVLEAIDARETELNG